MTKLVEATTLVFGCGGDKLQLDLRGSKNDSDKFDSG
jgi:hypothetical protein